MSSALAIIGWHSFRAMAVLSFALWPLITSGEDTAANPFRDKIRPLLVKYCFECHGGDSREGKVTFDKVPSDAALLADRDLWWRAIKNVRAGLMPPHGEPRPKTEELTRLVEWVKSDVFQTDLKNPDPGRVTLRRLNRIEYKNTIRDLMGIDYDVDGEFPPDNTGYGFDTIGDVLNVSPLLLEKYMNAAQTIVDRAVPRVSKAVREEIVSGKEFKSDDGRISGARLSAYEEQVVSQTVQTELGSEFRLTFEIGVRGGFNFDPNRLTLTFAVDGKTVHSQEYGWQANKTVRHEVKLTLEPGKHTLTCHLVPVLPADKKNGEFIIELQRVLVTGPLDPAKWAAPPNYSRFFFKPEPPVDDDERKQYAREVLERFATKAFRRPPGKLTLDRLTAIADRASAAEASKNAKPDTSFEHGTVQAMLAVLASPRFLFRLEETVPDQTDRPHGQVDEYSLASRLSYFLWSSMPDEELFRLADRNELRKNLSGQVRRMMDDSRSSAFISNFTGQWLQARDIESVSIDVGAVVRRDAAPPVEGAPRRFPRGIFEAEVRRAMREETELYFDHIVRADRPIVELLDSDYTFLNERLAKHYDLPDVTGPEMRKVTLPKDSPRGGILTQGTMLVVTSNPTRTSPVKRGVFILDNILGTPAPPPPEAVPALEDSEKGIEERVPSLREVLHLHRRLALCSSCHSRMDPLGLALENFNALGMWRDKDRGQPIESAGELITGEKFRDIREMKRVLSRERRPDFYRCLAEKLLIYAVGRGLDYYDMHTVDQIVQRLENEEGKFSALLTGVIESPAFQMRRNAPAKPAAANTTPPKSKP